MLESNLGRKHEALFLFSGSQTAGAQQTWHSGPPLHVTVVYAMGIFTK